MTAANEISCLLRDCGKAECFIYLGSQDPAADLIPVPRYLLEASAELLELLQSQVLTLRNLSVELAGVVDEITQLAGASPEVHRRLQAVRDLQVST